MGDLFLLMDNTRTNGFLQLDQIEVVPAGLEFFTWSGEGYSPGFAALKVPAAEPGGGA